MLRVKYATKKSHLCDLFPRSGSTLLQRMLGSHSAIFTHPEPHLLTPLNYLGYFDTVDKAPYDHINAANALREFCDELPNGEQDYLDALRAYSSTIYARVLSTTQKTRFLDKTPAYALVWPFIAKLYPHAKYVVLTRHPLAIWHSQAHSFFHGDFQQALDTNPIVKPYVESVGRLLLEAPVSLVRVRYEDLVEQPEQEMQRVLKHLGLEFEPGVVEYGKTKHITKSYGDPMSVEKHDRPVTNSLHRWASDLLARPKNMQLAKQVMNHVDPNCLQAWGYPLETIFDALQGQQAQRTHQPFFHSYRLKRWILLRLRKNIHHNLLGMIVKKIRYACDVLLRT